MIRATLALVLLGACASVPEPVVTSAGTSADGRRAWFAVTRGEELTIYACEGQGCYAVPRSDEPARRLPTVGEAPRASEERDQAGEEATEEEANESVPDEERLDLMDGVL